MPPLRLWHKLSYGFGSVAYGVKNNGYDYFLLMFYSIVLGVDARLVGFGLLIALVFDAISDPLVGYVSDNLKSRWGRRHPFMYAAALPVALCYFFLWSPGDGWSEIQLVIYMTVLSVLIRTLITFYETPSSALAPELTQSYHGRTRLLAFRHFFGWTGGNAMSVLMFAVLIVNTAEFPDGRFNLAGWTNYGVIASLLMLLAILVSAVGTHSRIPHLTKPARVAAAFSLKKMVRDVYQTLSDKSFVSLIMAALFSAIATGVSASIVFTIYTSFWELSSYQLFILTVCVFLSAILAFTIMPLLSKIFANKKTATILLGVLAFGAAPVPIALRLAGLMPENGDPLLFQTLLVFNTLDVALIISMQTMFSSMVADLVEESEVKTGRRSEGIFFASITFIRKCTQGIGVLVAGFIIELAGFPKQTLAKDIPPEALFNLGALYAPALWILWGAMLVAIGFYRIDRRRHEENLRHLQMRIGESGRPA